MWPIIASSACEYTISENYWEKTNCDNKIKKKSGKKLSKYTLEKDTHSDTMYMLSMNPRTDMHTRHKYTNTSFLYRIFPVWK